MNYYTYAYLREDGTPYYIGKGDGYRAYHKGRGEIKPPKVLFLNIPVPISFLPSYIFHV